jgi:hypothetical protein
MYIYIYIYMYIYIYIYIWDSKRRVDNLCAFSHCSVGDLRSTFCVLEILWLHTFIYLQSSKCRPPLLALKVSHQPPRQWAAWVGAIFLLYFSCGVITGTLGMVCAMCPWHFCFRQALTPGISIRKKQVLSVLPLLSLSYAPKLLCGSQYHMRFGSIIIDARVSVVSIICYDLPGTVTKSRCL